LLGEMVEPGRLIPPLPPPRRRKSSPHVGKRGTFFTEGIHRKNIEVCHLLFCLQ
jgi:hypothetical protein